MLSELDSQFSRLTGAKQTMSSWAVVIESPSVVPAPYRDAWKSLIQDGESFPYMVLAPAQAGLGRRSTEKLLCLTKDSLHILEKSGRRLVTSSFDISSITQLEIGNILIYSWFSVTGRTGSGAEKTCFVEFNEATRRHLEPIFTRLRPDRRETGEADQKVEQDKFQYLEPIQYKFMNFARESLVSGEKVLYSIWEPKIRQSWLRRFRLPVMRTLHTAHLLILTDQEVILIREDERVTENKGIRYGGVWQFIPVRQIATAEIVDPDRDTIQLVLSLSSASRIRIPFSQSRLAELKEFIHTANWS